MRGNAHHVHRPATFDGRGGDDGSPIRKTPWGEIAYQLAGDAGLNEVAQHEREMVAPAGDVIVRFDGK